jgi:hypothetical protein
MELRKATRYRVSAPALFWWRGADGTLQQAQGISRDISDRGVFVLAKDLPPPGVHVELQVHLPAVAGTSGSAQFTGEGPVVRTSGPASGESGFAAAAVFHAGSSDDVALFGPEEIQ